MIKHQEIINNLTIEQKISLLADVTSLGYLNDKESKPFIKVNSLAVEKGWLDYPAIYGLANSWNEDLIRSVGIDVLGQAKNKGTNLVDLPCSSTKISPYATGVSEDPVLTGKILGAIVSAGNEVGVATCLVNPVITKDDVEFSDKVASERAIREYITAPRGMLFANGVSVIRTGKNDVSDKYAQLNDAFINNVALNYPVIYDASTLDENDAIRINSGKFYVKGNAEALLTAYNKYVKLLESFEKGEISLSDVNIACETGTAISDEMINEAVDRVLIFVEEQLNVLDKEKIDEASPLLAYEASQESIVLLKNKKALPLNSSQKVCLIGGLAEYKDGQGETIKSCFERRASELGQYVGFSSGYNHGKEKNDDLIIEACMKATESDVIVVVVGNDEDASIKSRRDKNTRLPANQVALLEKLKMLKKKVVAIVCGDTIYDMDFDKYCDAVVLAQSSGRFGAIALLNIIYGKACPSGRITNTYYVNTDDRFKKIKNYKEAERNEVGTFYGYRHYDTGKYKVKYPFGYGLSYTTFEYSNFSVSDSKVAVKIKNTGKIEGGEVVQLYVGKENSNIIRPTKELKAFQKIFLKPGKSTKVIFDLNELNLTAYDEENKKMSLEDGEYTVYVATNVSDVKFSGTFTKQGETFTSDNKKLSQFFQNCSNVYDGKYGLEEAMPEPKLLNGKAVKGLLALLCTAGIIGVIYLYLSSIGWLPSGPVLYILLALFVGVPLVIYASLKLKTEALITINKGRSKAMKIEKRNKLNIEDLAEELPYEQLFVDEFEEAIVEVSKEEEIETVQEKDVFRPDVVFNREFTLKTACDEMSIFMRERGVYVSPANIRSVFSAMASSRLIVFGGDDKMLLNKFIGLLGEYFEYQSKVEDFTDLETKGGDIIHYFDGEKTEISDVAKALIEDEWAYDRLRVMSVVGVKSDSVKPCLTHVFRYIDQAGMSVKLTVKENGRDVDYDMPENAWFILTLADDEKIIDIPKYIVETACIVDLPLREVEEKPEFITQVIVKEVEEQETEQVIEETSEVAVESVDEVSEEIVEETNAEESVEEISEEVVEEVVEEAIEETTEAVVEEQVITESTEESVETAEEDEPVKTYEEIIQIPNRTPVTTVGYYQFTKMIELACRDSALDEAIWKRLDKLEDAVIKADADFRIHSKLWQKIEKYVSVYLNAGGEPEEAIDSVVANHVISTMIPSILQSNGKLGEKFTHVIENIFGEGHVPQSIKAVKSTGLKI